MVRRVKRPENIKMQSGEGLRVGPMSTPVAAQAIAKGIGPRPVRQFMVNQILNVAGQASGVSYGCQHAGQSQK